MFLFLLSFVAWLIAMKEIQKDLETCPSESCEPQSHGCCCPIGVVGEMDCQLFSDLNPDAVRAQFIMFIGLIIVLTTIALASFLPRWLYFQLFFGDAEQDTENDNQ